MSRIGKLPIQLPQGVTVDVNPQNIVTVKGPKGTLTQEIKSGITLNVEGNQIELIRPSDSKEHKAMHGLYRTLVSNMVVGVSVGYKKEMELVGVGYKATTKGDLLELSLGHSHPIIFQLPSEVSFKTIEEKGKNPLIVLESPDKQLIGMVAAKIRSYRKPEPYKGKGVKFVGEVIRRKAGKSASKK